VHVYFSELVVKRLRDERTSRVSVALPVVATITRNENALEALLVEMSIRCLVKLRVIGSDGAPKPRRAIDMSWSDGALTAVTDDDGIINTLLEPGRYGISRSRTSHVLTTLLIDGNSDALDVIVDD
jgi:hypothetical protein